MLPAPWLRSGTLSPYFKSNRDEYHLRLQLVREKAEWEGWVTFFLRGVKETSEQAATAGRIYHLDDVR